MAANPPNRAPLVIGLAIGVVVAIAAGVAILSSGGDDDDDAGAAATTEAAAGPTGGSPPSSGDPEYPAVEVSGTPLAPLEDPADDAAVGATPPTLTGSTYGGEPLTIDPADGPTMVVFLAHWCPHCNAEIPQLLEWRDAGMIPDDLDIVGVSTAARSDAPNYPPSQWLQDRGWEWPTMGDDVDASALEAWGGTGFPFFVIVGADGRVKARASGEIEVDDLDALVDEALAA